MKQNIQLEYIANCRFCTMINADEGNRTPICCTKFSGSVQPICVNINTCITCGEYKKAFKNHKID